MSQLCRVNQDPVEISGLLGVIEMKGLGGMSHPIQYQKNFLRQIGLEIRQIC
jgi:hypothetical protein